MQEVWAGLWNRLSASGDPGPIYQDLVHRYSEPGRAYHNLGHIRHCLLELAVIPEPEDIDAIEFALWFHDAIYDTKGNDNEEQSANLALDTAIRANLPTAFAGNVVELILATKHAAAPTSPATQLIVDIDLAILGQSESVFEEYEREIRVEYAWVPEQDFRKGRSAILAMFLGRERIYSTALFHDRYEARARENIAQSLQRLS